MWIHWETWEQAQVNKTGLTDKDIRELTDYIHTKGLINKQGTGKRRKRAGNHAQRGY